MNSSYIKKLLIGGGKRRKEFCRTYPNMCRLFKKIFAEKLELIDKLICPYCKKQFKALRTFSKHISNKHNGELMDDVYQFIDLWKKLRKDRKFIFD
jgi:uncharacterized C2H2 Zn-finger protein